jgi:hypothetical protein
MRIAPGVAMAGCFILARGCLVLGPAFAHDPAGAWAPFAAIASYGTAFFGSGSIVTETANLGPVGIALTSVGVVAAIVAAAWRWRHDGARGAGLDLVEHALVATLCLVASPLFAVGCYFLLVHSWRHAVRLGTTPEMVGSDAASRPALGLVGVLDRRRDDRVLHDLHAAAPPARPEAAGAAAGAAACVRRPPRPRRAGSHLSRRESGAAGEGERYSRWPAAEARP